jgi:phosphate acetyltransferase
LDNIYVMSIEARSGKTLAALGLMELASRRVERVGFFRPVIRDGDQPDPIIELMRARYGLAEGPERLYGLRYADARELAESGRREEALQQILERYERVASDCDVVICDGTDYSAVSAPFEFAFNAQIASHLGASIFFVANGHDRQPDVLLEGVQIARRAFAREGCSIVATLINRVPPDEVEAVRALCRAHWQFEDPVYIAPEDGMLGRPTLSELVQALDGRVLYGSDQLQNVAQSYVVADMQLAKLLERIEPGSLVITSGDRADILLGCLASLRSGSCPNLAGILLTGGLELPESIVHLMDGLRLPEFPVISVAAGTYACTSSIEGIHTTVRADDDRKVATTLGLFEANVDLDELEDRVRLTHSTTVTPLRFEYQLIARAKAKRQRIVLPEGKDERILRAAEILLRRGVADITLLGDPAELRELEGSLGLDLDGVEIIDPLNSEMRGEFAKLYAELRSHKGVTLEMANDIMTDVSYFGTMMVHQGRADGMVSGAAHTTAHTIRPALEFIRTREGISMVSSIFLMCLEDRVLVYGDCAINPRPSAEELADIATSSADTALLFGIEPRVAMLSYSTGESGSGEEVDKVRRATELARKRRPDLSLEGPIQYDAAVDASVASKKLPESEVAGRATVFIFPDLNTGNNTYKAVQRSAGAVAIGPVLQGLRKPVNDLSRGCTVPDIVNTVAVTAIQAQTEDPSTGDPT